ncbi:hypothetical protein T4C_3405 [Trichinella pseudospiralis]|uniref:Uncharacterized protein n=1 Tax=Trichinella pseudospiralis TaxID=6337 RepID=A0A0V1GFW2_TRIPS|nr:hypothetical protein T4C_3405 [Trichinella pseudospiralis]
MHHFTNDRHKVLSGSVAKRSLKYIIALSCCGKASQNY